MFQIPAQLDRAQGGCREVVVGTLGPLGQPSENAMGVAGRLRKPDALTKEQIEQEGSSGACR